MSSASTPLHAAYRDAGATLGEIFGMTTGIAVPGAAGGLYLADLTALPKWLLVGGGAAAILADARRDVPPLMQVRAGVAGAFIACRAPRQFLLCAGTDAMPASALTAAPCALRYDSVDLALGGGSGEYGVDDLLAEACSTDLGAFGTDAWVPSLLFGVEVALWRVAATRWRVQAAPADGEFLCTTLLAAVRQRHGGLTGFHDYLALPANGAT